MNVAHKDFASVIDWTDFFIRILQKDMKGIIALTSNSVVYVYLLNERSFP